MLDNVQYVIMTFIRGPVCRGQVALNVIDDQFWIMFLDPESDLSVRYPGFLKLQENNLRLPTERPSTMGLVNLFNDEYRKDARTYLTYREDYYMSHYYHGMGYDSIWKGNGPEDTPMLTVYRHFDSASVHRGALGDLPKSMWVIDYPLLERIYYALVAGFDVYGTVTHQVAVRLYMDSLRMEAESYFLDFLPQDQRAAIRDSWYIGADKKYVEYYDSNLPAAIPYVTDKPKREFIETLVKEHYPKSAAIVFDEFNYLQDGEDAVMPTEFKTRGDYLQGFKAVSRKGTAFFKLVTDHNINLAHVRIRIDGEDDFLFSIVINRWHDNVSFMLKEDKYLESDKDSADFMEGFIGSYPNMFFDLSLAELPAFLKMINAFTGSPEDIDLIWSFAVNRGRPDFWNHYD
ncbi:MAG: fatty acid cis/trans isomerase, partial [Spirochaetales bacterium]|nr:fatty acid cis/trans isomerase [Spirochaetales bacterium]